MTPQTEAILTAVVQALDAKAPAHPYYIRQPMLAVADTIIEQLKEKTNGSSDYVRRCAYGHIRP